MTISLGDEFNKPLWRCDICGKKGFWDKNWWWYGSIALQETCPLDLPCACSDECMKILKRKIKTRVFILPRLKRDGYHSKKVSERVGY